jgi:hypothetical protein
MEKSYLCVSTFYMKLRIGFLCNLVFGGGGAYNKVCGLNLVLSISGKVMSHLHGAQI